MIFLFYHLVLLATDLFLAVILSCFLYAFAFISIAFLTCFIIFWSFGIVEKNVDIKGRAIVILVSNSSIGRTFARNLDKAGFRVSAAHWPPQEEGTTVKEECSSRMEVAQLHMTDDQYQKTMKTFIESHLSLKACSSFWDCTYYPEVFTALIWSGSLKLLSEVSAVFQDMKLSWLTVEPGTYGLMKKPSILIWEEEEPDTCTLPERRTPHKWKVFRVPALCITVLFCPLNCALTFLKKRVLQPCMLLKSKN